MARAVCQLVSMVGKALNPKLLHSFLGAPADNGAEGGAGHRRDLDNNLSTKGLMCKD
jgi:hypothetical protein